MKTNQETIIIRAANSKDIPTILDLIKELAIYEEMLEQVTATEEVLHRELIAQKNAEALIVEYDKTPVAFALFFHNFSTFVGKKGLYIEDIYVKPEMRGQGIGKMLFTKLAQIAVERDCGRMEWSCLDWNEPSIKFYESLGAKQMDEWTVHRLTGDKLHELAAKKNS